MHRTLLLVTGLFAAGCHAPVDPSMEADDTEALQALVSRGGVVRLSKPEYRITKPIIIDLAQTGFTCIEGGTVARVVMAGPGPAFRFIAPTQAPLPR